MKTLRFISIPAVLFLLGGTVNPLFAQWEPDVRLTYNDSSSGTSYNNAWCVAATGNTVHVVWSDGRIGERIYYKRSLDCGTSWSADSCLTDSPGPSYLPSIAVSNSFVHLIWSDFRDGDEEIYYKRSTDGGSNWEPDQRLTFAAGLSEVSSAAVSGSDVHIVWWDNRSGGTAIYYIRSTNSGLQWFPDTCLSQASTDSWASVAASGTTVHVVWDVRPGVVYYKRSSDRGASWSPTIQLSSRTAMAPCVASLDSLVHVTWEGPSIGGYYQIFYKRSTDGGMSWLPDTILPSGLGSFLPSICVSGRVVHVVWFSSSEDIFYNHSTDNGISWQTFYTQLTNDTCRSEYSSVAASDSAVHVVWMDNRDGNWEIYYKRNSTGNLVGTEGLKATQRQVFERNIYIVPNPFTSFATVPGHSTDRFTLYDISGRRVGTYKGDRIGADVPPGVYFLKDETGHSKPLRIVKLR
jgi:hypothetical protein